MSSGHSFRVLMLAHDLTDAAIRRRLAMLQAGGASVTLAGFRRSDVPVEAVNGCPTIDLGQTHNGAFLKRILAVVRSVFTLRRHRQLFAETDVILARNLEMLTIAVRGRSLAKSRPTVIYEILDIHRLLLAKNFIGSTLRALEGWLSRRSGGALTSSPAFIMNYFRRLARISLPIRLVENKLLDSEGQLPLPEKDKRTMSPPWRIGWFGILRCRQSLLMLRDLALQSQGSVEVVIRGRPALDQMPDFHDIVAATPGLSFHGPYQNPEDLAAIYSDVHFAWAIDRYEEGQNSSWLLPNRIYEGAYYGAVPIAIAGLETSNFLQKLGIGVRLKEPLGPELAAFFSQLTREKYSEMSLAREMTPRSVWVYEQRDCQGLVDWLRAVHSAQQGRRP